MNISTIAKKVVVSATLLGLGGAGVLALAQPEPAPLTPAQAAPQPDFSAMTKKQLGEMMEQMTGPTEAHERLEFMLGKSEHDVKMTMGHGIPDMTAKAVGEGEWALGKRFVITRTKPAPGEEMPTEAMNIFGYDTRKKEYFWIGLDTMGTYFVTAVGDYDAERKTFTLIGEETHEQIGKVRHRMLIIVGDNGTSTSAIEFEMQPGTGEWSRVVEIKARKVK